MPCHLCLERHATVTRFWLGNTSADLTDMAASLRMQTMALGSHRILTGFLEETGHHIQLRVRQHCHNLIAQAIGPGTTI
jgi:hypothetical protein